MKQLKKPVVRMLVAAIAAVGLPMGAAWAVDVYENGTEDDGTGTDNVILHHAPARRHDLQAVGGVADIDFHRISPRDRRSYEVQVMNVSGSADLASGTSVQLRASDGSTVIQNAVGLEANSNLITKTIRWISAADAINYVTVSNGSTVATADAQYEIQGFETTLYCPRWNNSGTQVSVLIVQGTGQTETSASTLCNWTAYFYNEGSTLVGQTSDNAAANDVDVVSLAGVAGLPGNKGGAHIAHTCGYGGLTAKLVALEPATGFSFDTPCTTLPR